MATRPSERNTRSPSQWLAKQASFSPMRDLAETRARVSVGQTPNASTRGADLS